mgnify:CR=1 FL=1
MGGSMIKSIIDFIFIMFFFGNDFLPNHIVLPSKNINNVNGI